VYTLYGPEAAGDLLTILGRLFTTFLQSHGFTCGIDDLILDNKAEVGRRADFVKGVEVGVKATRTAADPLPSQSLEFAMQEKFRMMEDFGALLDQTVSGAMSAETSAIVKKCLPGGQMKSFPMNFFSLMTNSGAKGSLVNFTQISCLLGQLELEGRRPPVMPSGKTLPSFKKYDPTPRAGGYVTDRFLTGNYNHSHDINTY
jgi:DNA-directed RNA polymerase I subunit RPA1